MIRGKVVKRTCPVCGFDYAVMSYISGVRTFKCCNCGEVVDGKVVRRQGYFFQPSQKDPCTPPATPQTVLRERRFLVNGDV